MAESVSTLVNDRLTSSSCELCVCLSSCDVTSASPLQARCRVWWKRVESSVLMSGWSRAGRTAAVAAVAFSRRLGARLLALLEVLLLLLLV